jgi:sodium-coupled neutral amino acid transporter 9
VTLFSTVLFALISHPSVSPILKNSKNPLSNSKSIYLGYLLTFILFILIGIFGGIGLIGRDCLEGNTVISYFVGSVLSYTMTIPVLLYLFCIFAIYPYVARNQVLGLIEFFTNNPFTKQKYHYHFSFILILFLLLSIFINLNPAIIISFIGSVMCWLSCFLFPCIIRLK